MTGSQRGRGREIRERERQSKREVVRERKESTRKREGVEREKGLNEDRHKVIAQAGCM